MKTMMKTIKVRVSLCLYPPPPPPPPSLSFFKPCSRFLSYVICDGLCHFLLAHLRGISQSEACMAYIVLLRSLSWWHMDTCTPNNGTRLLMHIGARTHTRARAQARTHTHTHTHTGTYTCTWTNVHTHLHTPACAHTHMHAYIHTPLHTKTSVF